MDWPCRAGAQGATRDGITAGTTLIPAVLGTGSLFAYRRFLLGADELRRKIELDSLAVAFGVGVAPGRR